jgi:ABC-2 type transport system permease protein
MSKLWIIIKREYAQVVKKKSFLIGILLTPAFMALVIVLPALLATKESDTMEKIAVVDLDGQGIGEKFAEEIKSYKLTDSSPAYEVTEVITPNPADTAEVNQVRHRLDSLILAKSIKSYLILDRGIESNDSCFMVAKSFGLQTGRRFDKVISRILSQMRLEKSDINLSTDSVMTLTRRVTFEQLAPGGKERDFLTTYFAGLIFIMIIFATVVTYGQVLMRSVIEEKNSRIIEVMVSSVSPFQLMGGKIVGLGLASLTQVGIWIALGAIIYLFKGNMVIAPAISDTVFNPVFIIFFLCYMLLGYLMYSTIFALIGAIVNNEKEAQNYIFPVTMLNILPILLSSYIIREPESTLTTVLSLIPFLTPTMMILRLNIMGPETFSFVNPIIVEATIGVVLTFLATVAIIWITGRIFRIGILMYGKRPTLPEILRWITYK